jgi:hypothetical protein
MFAEFRDGLFLMADQAMIVRTLRRHICPEVSLDIYNI